MRSAASLSAAIFVLVSGDLGAARAASASDASPSALPAASVSIGDFEEARYDEARLNKLIDLCKTGYCPQALWAAIDARLETVARERHQFSEAKAEADYRAYLSTCVACQYRVEAERLMKPAVAAPAPSGSPPSSTLAPVARSAPPAPKSWHTVAHLAYRVRGRARVAIGYSGPQSSPLEAERAAKEKCESISDGRECDVSRAASAGCYYVTVGSSRHAAGWVTGSNKEDTYNRCKDEGYSCKIPIGGCLD